MSYSQMDKVSTPTLEPEDEDLLRQAVADLDDTQASSFVPDLNLEPELMIVI